MFGRDIDTLNVYADYYYNGNDVSKYNRTLIWRLSGTKGNKWLQGRKTINATSDFKVVFEGVVGKSYLGDIGKLETHYLFHSIHI